MMTDKEWNCLAMTFNMSPQSKIQNFIRQLDADAPVALYKYFNNDTWYKYIIRLIDNNLHCTISYSTIDEISQEFLEFIDGNGFSYKRPKGCLSANENGSISQKVFIKYEPEVEE